MTCCEWKRSENDALYDSQTGTTYCGTCWHSYIQSHIQNQTASKRNLVNTGNEQKVKEETEGEDNYSVIDNDAALHPLKVQKHIDGKEYYISKSRRLVFSKPTAQKITPKTNTKLTCVGEYTNDNDIKLLKVTTVATTRKFPFKIEPSDEDHCETPEIAYKDIVGILKFYAQQINKTSETLIIWDPYYCAGSIKNKLKKYGFDNVINECVDFYSLEKIPNYDILITNPPYSTTSIDHIEKLMSFVVNQDKPWFILQPNYVYMKSYWNDLIQQSKKLCPRPFFLTPESPRKYKYKTPCGLRLNLNSQSLKTSPFITFWYASFGKQFTYPFYQWYIQNYDQLTVTLACTEFFLPDSFKDSNDKTRRKIKKKKQSVREGGIQKKKRRN